MLHHVVETFDLDQIFDIIDKYLNYTKWSYSFESKLDPNVDPTRLSTLLQDELILCSERHQYRYSRPYNNYFRSVHHPVRDVWKKNWLETKDQIHKYFSMRPIDILFLIRDQRKLGAPTPYINDNNVADIESWQDDPSYTHVCIMRCLSYSEVTAEMIEYDVTMTVHNICECVSTGLLAVSSGVHILACRSGLIFRFRFRDDIISCWRKHYTPLPQYMAVWKTFCDEYPKWRKNRERCIIVEAITSGIFQMLDPVMTTCTDQTNELINRKDELNVRQLQRILNACCFNSLIAAHFVRLLLLGVLQIND